MATIELCRVRKDFGTLTVIPELDLSVDDGEFLVLVGPSGCGKSTLLRMIAGLEDVTAGELRIGGRTVTDLAARHRDIAMVFQNYALYPHMTVRQNMAFSMKLRRADAARIDASVDAAAEILGLGPLLDRYPRQLSGGQRQRVAMGRAIVRDPKAFLFDEPLSNLDAKLRVQMRTEIRALQQRLGTTTVYVTHDQSEAMTMADRIVLLNGGCIEQIGAPLDIYDGPQTVFAAGFIGSPAINLLDGVAETSADRLTIRAGTMHLPVPALRHPPAEGQPVLYGIRPELLTFADDGAIEATVHVVEPNGPDTLVIGMAAGKEVRILTQQRVSLASGRTIRLAPQAAGAMVFDPETGHRFS
jgi:multiple sugar transport system ATP-binding protein